MSDFIYPPKQIHDPKLEKKDFELIILWMLYNNKDTCEWSDFTNEPLQFRLSTLSKYLSMLKGKGYVENYERGHYRITPEGKKRYHEKTKVIGQKKKLNYPPDVIRRRRNYDQWILWMVYNNNYCKWSDFLEKPLSINQSALSKNLNLLIDQKFIKKENKEYRITRSGKIKYSNMLQIYDLDRQSILNEETKRIEDITKKTRKFFEKYNIEDIDTQFRFLSNALKLDYTRVESMLTDEEDFDRILLFISMNHPDQYPKNVSMEEFSTEYEIKESKLEYYIDEIVEKNIYPIKFFKLTAIKDTHYYFQENERLEIMFRAIVEDYITKFTYINKLFSRTANMASTVDHILEDACEILFDSGLKDSLKEFIPIYISYLAYKIEAKEEFKEPNDKLEGIIWQDIPEIFQSGNETLKDQYKEEITKLDEEIEKNPEKLELYNSKLTILIYYNQYDDVLNLLNEMVRIFPERERDIKMKKASALKSMKELGEGLEIINELLEESPEDNDLLNYKAYWLQYLGRREEAQEIIQDLVDRIPDNGMYHDTYGEILMYFEEYEEAVDEFQRALELASDDWYAYQTYIKLGICYKELENYDLASDNLLKGMELSNKPTFDVEPKQKWLVIAELFLKQIETFL